MRKGCDAVYVLHRGGGERSGRLDCKILDVKWASLGIVAAGEDKKVEINTVS